MNRRMFLASTAAVCAAPALLMEGCSVNVLALITSVENSALAVIKVALPNSPWVPQLQAAITALQTATATWQNGGAVQIIIEALNTVQAVLAVIPVTAVYSPLIAILVAGIEAVLSALPRPLPGPVPTNGPVTAAISRSPYLTTHRAYLKKPHAFQSYQGAYRDQWNSTAVSIGLAQAKI